MQPDSETASIHPSRLVVTQRICLWTVPVIGAILAAAFVAFPGFFPPMSPEMTAEEVAAFYREHASQIQFSMVTFNLFGVMLIPFSAVIVIQMKRMATPSQVLAYCYLTAAASGATVFALADLFWLLAAFRPARDPELIMLLNDMAWIIFIAPVGMFVVQNICLALAVFLDERDRPVFPRWVAPFSLLVGAALTPAAGAAVFTTGPLAWNGSISFWMRLIALGIYIAVMFFVARSAITRQAEEEAARTQVELAL
ncbi:hypothetical protein [Mycobacterium sp.]|uniref:hypothetical protein n=1 Tax=Mycobacterium sp. TaxID=1785 RepID=UPI002D843BAE|nr:hypothetical protein [Mycobacterium sp.]